MLFLCISHSQPFYGNHISPTLGLFVLALSCNCKNISQLLLLYYIHSLLPLPCCCHPFTLVLSNSCPERKGLKHRPVEASFFLSLLAHFKRGPCLLGVTMVTLRNQPCCLYMCVSRSPAVTSRSDAQRGRPLPQTQREDRKRNDQAPVTFNMGSLFETSDRRKEEMKKCDTTYKSVGLTSKRSNNINNL